MVDCVYLKRKIDDWLLHWKEIEDKSPALIVGIRQCGKTESIEEFAHKHFNRIIEVNFWDNPNYLTDFDGSLDVNTIISNLSIRFPNIEIRPEDTLIF